MTKSACWARWVAVQQHCSGLQVTAVSAARPLRADQPQLHEVAGVSVPPVLSSGYGVSGPGAHISLRTDWPFAFVSDVQGAGLVDELTVCWAMISLKRCSELVREMVVSVPLYTGSIFEPVSYQARMVGALSAGQHLRYQCLHKTYVWVLRVPSQPVCSANVAPMYQPA